MLPRTDELDLGDRSTTSLISVDPHHGQQLVCHGYTVLLSNPDGSISAGGRQGLYDFDTRVLSTYELWINKQRPRLDSCGLLDPARWTVRLTMPIGGGSEGGPRLPQDAIELVLRRRVGHGMVDEMALYNRSAAPTSCTLSVRCDADFADVLRLDAKRRRSDRRRTWDPERQALTFDYQAANGAAKVHRAIRIRVLRPASLPQAVRQGLRFDVTLGPRASWSATLVFETLVDGEWRSPVRVDNDVDLAPILRQQHSIAERWQADRTHVASDPPLLGLVVERAADDLLALRNWEYDAAPDAWIPNAGLPSYTGLFGRDTLTAGWQALLITPEIATGALAKLTETQAAIDAAWHDAEPGKMIHEQRRGPLCELGLDPRRRYFGTQTSSSFFVVVLSELWHWTGDDHILDQYRDAALRTFEWADRYGDRDGDGLLEYETRSSAGLRNHGWKDSNEAIRHEDGSLADTPIATYEEQAYHWLAQLRMAEMLLVRGEKPLSREFLDRARRLRRRCHDVFWMPDRRFYAMAIDGHKRPVTSIGSNAGHALAAGLIAPEYAEQVADRLMSADMFSGWGIRTLSAGHQSYNPLAYHLGAVWPVEAATIALGFKRYGLDHHTLQLVTAMFAAASCFRDMRLPEALAGHSRTDAPIPTLYPQACSPQAWSASAAIQGLQALLGLYPVASAHLLAVVRPELPPGVRTVTIRNLRVGSARVSLRFERHGAETRYEVVDKSGELHLLGVPPPQDVHQADQDWRDRLLEWLLKHAPGRKAAAIRIALGV